MRFFHIQVAIGLLEPKHHEQMGTAIWEYLWLLDRVTKIDDAGEGWVLGGKPIKLELIAKALGEHKMTAQKNIARLVEKKYIAITRTPFGLGIRLCKAKKALGK